MRGRTALVRGLVVRGLVVRGLVVRGLVVRGLVVRGLVVLPLLGASCTGVSVAAGARTSGAHGTPATSKSTTSSTAPRAPTAGAPAATTTTEPPFVSTISTITAADVPYTWRPGCPVGPSDLRMLHLSYWGFDGGTHVGTMVVNAAVVSAVVAVFSTLYGERFPVHAMQPEDAYRGSDPASMADDNTSGFNCRYAVAPGPPSWSVHAYGEAIDVNPVENPYYEGGQWQPSAGAAFADRAAVRPGMAEPGGELVEAFAAQGWQWGGRWTSTPDYQHFSDTGN